ncbi:LysE family translocator [Oceanicoccus sagamiensis]|uniref:Lysine transporter LysE n=1 Tax=Oceanicoccus sagamiensis TaxID=716816 RepID=A0A1X9N8R8_9GAMM|nr:LysE family translocator [Oceanicoccus sagamiensis]ARN73571.1 hypothetical protein BST96_05215 [Oceanicoccus sagamiensis]
MEFTAWLSLLAICTLGAMSPGPSIAIIIQITAQRGRGQGITASIAHGIGVACYAFLAVLGLAVALEQYPLLFQTLQLLGAAFLAFLGLKALGVQWPKGHIDDNSQQPAHSPSSSNSFIVGFLTAALNPKVALFFIALFSQFVRPEAGILEKTMMASTAAIVDALWYSIVAMVVSKDHVASKFSRYSPVLEKIFGVLLVAVAIRVAWGM